MAKKKATKKPSRIRVSLNMNGDTTNYRYDANLKVGAVIGDVVRKTGLTTFVVNSSNGLIAQNDKNKKLSTVGELSISPKNVGA